MKISKWSFAGMMTGLLFTLFSAARYFLLYPDLDRAIVYSIMGVLVICVSWLYNENLNTKNTLTVVEDYLAEKK